jgi:hypothetical protein
MGGNFWEFIVTKDYIYRFNWIIITLVSCSAYFSTLKMEAIYSSETSVDFQRTTRRYIPEDSTLHNHRSENLKSYIILINPFSLHKTNLVVIYSTLTGRWIHFGCLLIGRCFVMASRDHSLGRNNNIQLWRACNNLGLVRNPGCVGCVMCGKVTPDLILRSLVHLQLYLRLIYFPCR